MNRYFRNIKQSAYNLLLDLFALEKPMSKEQWAIYIARQLDSKVSELYESKELNYYTEEFNPNPDLVYALEVIRDNLNSRLVQLSPYTTTEYNKVCKQVADEYVDTLINKELAKYKELN